MLFYENNKVAFLMCFLDPKLYESILGTRSAVFQIFTSIGSTHSLQLATEKSPIISHFFLEN